MELLSLFIEIVFVRPGNVSILAKSAVFRRLQLRILPIKTKLIPKIFDSKAKVNNFKSKLKIEEKNSSYLH